MIYTIKTYRSQEDYEAGRHIKRRLVRLDSLQSAKRYATVRLVDSTIEIVTIETPDIALRGKTYITDAWTSIHVKWHQIRSNTK